MVSLAYISHSSVIHCLFIITTKGGVTGYVGLVGCFWV